MEEIVNRKAVTESDFFFQTHNFKDYVGSNHQKNGKDFSWRQGLLSPINETLQLHVRFAWINISKIKQFNRNHSKGSLNNYNNSTKETMEPVKLISKHQIHQVQTVKISEQGIFKYILIRCKIGGMTKSFIRGGTQFTHHYQIYDDFAQEIKGFGFKHKDDNIKWNRRLQAAIGDDKVEFVCTGGGRIQHYFNGEKCFVYGYSKRYGKVDHTIAQKLISQQLGYQLKEIKVSDKGY